MNKTFALLTSVILLSGTIASAQHPSMPAGLSHDEHLRQLAKDEQLKRRGALAMGFDQDKTTHHFRLSPTGGAIEVAANDAADTKSLKEIRTHFREIADAFSKGVFDKPVGTHDEMPPGAQTMAGNKDRIQYRYEERAGGAAVTITTADPETLSAIHEFLRYQIVEHKTGDPLTVQR